MPKCVTAPKKFLELANRPDAKCIKIKRIPSQENGEEATKFKLRTTKYLYTLVCKQAKISTLIKDSIPNGLEVIYLDGQKSA